MSDLMNYGLGTLSVNKLLPLHLEAIWLARKPKAHTH